MENREDFLWNRLRLINKRIDELSEQEGRAAFARFIGVTPGIAYDDGRLQPEKERQLAKAEEVLAELEKLVGISR